jgi:hypothetical protein
MTGENAVQPAINTIRTLSIDAVQQAKSGLMIGSLQDEFICVPIELRASRQKSVDRTGPVWAGVLAVTGQSEQL